MRKEVVTIRPLKARILITPLLSCEFARVAQRLEKLGKMFD